MDADQESYSSCTISDLPDEILLRIFSFVRILDIVRTVSLVCKRWNCLAADQSLYTELKFTCSQKHSCEFVQKLILRSQNLRVLHLEARDDTTDLIQTALDLCRDKLTSFSIRLSVSIDPGVLFSFIGLNNNLVYLDLKSVTLIDYENGEQAELDLCDMFTHLNNLKHLHLSYFKEIDDKCINTIVNNCKSLVYLDITRLPKIHDSSIRLLCCKLCHTLKHLILGGKELTDNAFKDLKKCENLVELDVSYCEELTDSGLEHFMGLKNLTSLTICNAYEVSASGMKRLFDAGGMSKLVYLNLAITYLIDDVTVSSIAAACPLLQELVLNWCYEITEVGLENIVEKCPSIKRMELVGLSKITANIFHDFHEKLPDLIFLDLRQCCGVNQDHLEYIVAKNPSLVIMDCCGELVIGYTSETDLTVLKAPKRRVARIMQNFNTKKHK